MPHVPPSCRKPDCDEVIAPDSAYCPEHTDGEVEA